MEVEMMTMFSKDQISITLTLKDHLKINKIFNNNKFIKKKEIYSNNSKYRMMRRKKNHQFLLKKSIFNKFIDYIENKLL